MKRVILSMVFSMFVVANAVSQDTAYLNMVNNKIRSIQPNGIIYYADKLRKEQIEKILETAAEEMIRLEKKGLVFTRSERKHVISAIKKWIITTQVDNLFPNSKRLAADSIIRFVENETTRIKDSLRKFPNLVMASAYYTHTRQWAFSFSEPIYLRKSTILIYYFMYYANSSGEEAVWVCKKDGLTWIRIGVLGGGAW